MHVAENDQSNFARRRKTPQRLVTVLHSNRIQPATADRHGRVMQIQHHVRCIARCNGSIDAIEFRRGYFAAGTSTDAAINADNQPLAVLQRVAIMKWQLAECFLHQRADIVIAGHAIHGQVEATEKLPEVLVSSSRIIRNQIACDNGNISLPVTCPVIFEYRGQRRVGDGASQAAVSRGEQVWVRKVQNPQQF